MCENFQGLAGTICPRLQKHQGLGHAASCRSAEGRRAWAGGKMFRILAQQRFCVRGRVPRSVQEEDVPKWEELWGLPQDLHGDCGMGVYENQGPRI